MTDKQKESAREYSNKHYKNNKNQKKIYQEENKEKIKLYKKEYFQKNKKEFYIRRKKSAKKEKKVTKEKTTLQILRAKENSKKWREKNKSKLREYNKIYSRKKILNDPLFKLKQRIRNSIRHSFVKKILNKNCKTEEILGCSFKFFKTFIESKWEPWMTWDNYGKYNGEFNFGWDIDHIIPIASAKTKDEIIKLNHFTNFQPLCSYTNRYVKRDNIL